MSVTTTAATERPKTAEEIERHWFENVYQGDRMKQLTPRALIMGMGLGMIMACSNVYVGLKAGWSMGVAITSCILAYTIFSTLHRLFPRWFPTYSILENNAMQSAASAAGAITSAGLVNAIPALMMLNPHALPAVENAEKRRLRCVRQRTDRTERADDRHDRQCEHQRRE